MFFFFQCSSECGQGVRQRTVVCTNPQGRCDPMSQPATTEPCEDHSKCYEWKTGEWSKVWLPLDLLTSCYTHFRDNTISEAIKIKN